jgi:long-chain acyl-CoA synthetase
MSGVARFRYVSSIEVACTDQESLTDMVWANAERFGDTVSFRRRVADSWLDVTAREFAGQVLGVAKGLIAGGLRAGDRVGLLCGNRFERSVVEFAIWTAGCVVVPVRTGGPGGTAGLRGAVVESGDGPDGIPAWRLDGELTELGAAVEDAEVHARRLAVGADDVATVRFDGEVGVRRTHGELLTEIRSTIARYPGLLGPGASMLVTLPLTHPLAEVISLGAVYTRTTLGQSADLADLGSFRPTVVVTSPGVLGQVRAAAKLKAHAEDRGRVYDAAEAVAVAYGRALAGPGPTTALRGKHLLASKFVYPKLRVALGGRCVAVISVGDGLDPGLEHFFLGIGIPVHST